MQNAQAAANQHFADVDAKIRREEQIAAAIGTQIMALKESGMSLRDAFDAVLGKGAYSRIAGEVYDALRAKAA